MKSLLIIPLVFLFFIGPEARAAEMASQLFPFVVPSDDTSTGVADMSFLNDRPADQLVTVRDGHFYAGDQRIRFWGMNNDYDANYPTPEQAAMLAKRFAKLGINLVRVTHTDQQYAPMGLFDPAFKGEMRIDPERMERLDYFIAELKKRGIYVELSVHVSHLRMMGRKGIPELGSQRHTFGTGLPLWNERFLAAEKQYARDFLGHVNPYTGKAYLEEPAVAFVEIINENGILCAWPRDHLKNTWSAALVADLQAAWNVWLKWRYQTTDALRRAWAAGGKEAGGVELLRNRDFSQGTSGWNLQCIAPSTGTLQVAPDGYQGKPCVVVTCEPKSDTSWHVNLQQTPLALEKSGVYELSFAAKADVPVRPRASFTRSSPPYSDLGLSMTCDLTREWQRFTQSFTALENEPQSRLMIRLAQVKNRLSFAEFSLRQAVATGLSQEQSLEGGTVILPRTPGDCQLRTPQVTKDVVDFLYEVDDRYFTTLYTFLKQELGCRHPIKGTQANSDYSSFFSQAKCDFIDVHGYWQHPRNANDRRNWTFNNLPMVNAFGSTVINLALCRVQGKPFNVSEYGHPAPNTHASEEIPTVASFGALQNWDGITLFTYAAHTPFGSDMITSFFEHKSHPTKRVTMPFGALAFRRGDVAPATQQISVGISLDDQKQATRSNVKRELLAARKGATWSDAFTHAFSLTLGSDIRPKLQPSGQPVTVSDTGELTYDTTKKDASILVINAPRAKAVIGYGAGKTFDLGGLRIKPGPTLQKGFAVITASVVTGNDFESSGAKVLLTATGYAENTGMGWNADKTSVGDRWGKGPVLCEGIPFEVILKAKRAKAWVLDPRGQRAGEIIAEPTAAGVVLRFGPQHKTLWYEIEVE